MVRMRRVAVSSSDTVAKVLRGLPRGGRLLGPLLGLVFLIYPIRAVLASDPSPMRVLFALAGATLFAGVFLWLIWMHEPLPPAADLSEVRKRRAAIAFLAVLVVALNLILGSEWRVLFFHVNIAAGFMLLRRDAYAAIAGLAVVTFVLGVFSGLAFSRSRLLPSASGRPPSSGRSQPWPRPQSSCGGRRKTGSGRRRS